MLDAGQQFFKQDAQLHPGEVQAKAQVDAVAERDLRVGFPVNLEAERIIEHRLVAVARPIE